MKNILFLIVLMYTGVLAGQYDKVKITPNIAYIYVYHKGKAVKVHRIQDTKHKLTGEYAITYRPGKDIQPLIINPNIKTIGEVELLSFMKEKGNKRKGVLIDVRPKQAYKKEAIPSAINIPLKIKDNPEKMKKVLQIFGAKKGVDGSLNMDNVLELAIYCNGLWCRKSSEFIETLLTYGYPTNKILYYRGGFQMWKILGFTTITNK